MLFKHSFRMSLNLLNSLKTRSIKPLVRFLSVPNTPGQIESFLAELQLNESKTGTIKPTTLFKLIELVKKSEQIQQSTSLDLIKLCGARLTHHFPHERQQILNLLFYDLLPNKSVSYETQHLLHYMQNTRLNNAHFNPFNISTLISSRNMPSDYAISSMLVSELCAQKEAQVAFSYIHHLIHFKQEKSLLSLKGDKFTPESLFDSIDRTFQHFPTNSSDLLNPFLKYFHSINNEILLVKMLNKMKSLQVNLNSATFTQLIIAYEKFNLKQCMNLFDKYKHDLTTSHLLEIYLNTDNQNLDSLILNKIEDESSEKLLIVNSIVILCGEKRFNKAFRILESCVINDELKKMCGAKLAVSLIEYEADLSTLIDYSTQLDNLVDNGSNLKLMIKHASRRSKKQLALKLVDELFRVDKSIDANIFNGLITHEANNLDMKIASLKEKNWHEIEASSNFQRITNLINLMDNRYKCKVSGKELTSLITLLRIGMNSRLREGIEMKSVVKHFRHYDKLDLFYACVECLSEFVASGEAERADLVLGELAELVGEMGVAKVEAKVARELARCVEKAASQEKLIDEPKNFLTSGVLKLIKQLNKIGEPCESLIGLNDLVFMKVSRVLTDLTQLKQFYEMNEICRDAKLLTASDEPSFAEVNEFKAKRESVQDLEGLIEDMKKKSKNATPAIRRLIIKLCKSCLDYNRDVIGRIEELVKELPITDLTPVVCHELMIFYYKFAIDIDKSLYYHDLLTQKNQSTDFKINKTVFLNLAKSVLRNGSKNAEKIVVNLFQSTKWYSDEKSLEKLREQKWYSELLGLASKEIYSSLNGDEFQAFIETIYKSKFLPRDFNLSSLVILKYLDEKKLDSALEYFKLNIEKFNLSLCEVILLKEILTDTKKQAESSEKKLDFFKQMLVLMSSKFGWELANNSMLHAYIMCGKFKNAEEFYTNQLNKTLNVNILNRLVQQFCASNTKMFKYKLEFKTNLKRFKVFQDEENAHREIVLNAIKKLNAN